MKILHTADWHIGKQLHKIDLSADIELFFEWLLNTIKNEEINLLLVSGDIFDQANPSQAALKQYYGFLKRMIGKNCKVIITGGNHDSASVLNAPKEILSFLDIEVVGGAPEDLNELFFEYKDDTEKVVIAAVPFLKDKDIRKSTEGETYSDKIEQIKEGIKIYFSKVNEHYRDNFDGCKFVVMAHLFVQGSHISESMRDIQIGNQAGVDGGIFGVEPDYVALGHIHKPYAVSSSHNIHYSGSPVSLSFSEKEDIKQVNIIDFSEDSTSVKILEIPKFRKLISFTGTLSEVTLKINDYEHVGELQALGEIIVNEEDENISTRQGLEDLILENTNELIHIVKSRLYFTNKVRGASEAFKTGTDVSEVTPMQMFEKKVDLVGDLENKEDLKNAFREILEKLNL
jgi:exonuclease SbcD